MKAVLIYGSYYGSTKQYALALSQRTGFPAVSFRDAPDTLSQFDVVVHLGGLYAGRVMGLSKTMKKLRQDGSQALVVVTVGLGDPDSPGTKEHIRESLRKKLPTALAQKAEFYHLRGAMDYSALTFRHKMMIRGFYLMVKKSAGESGDQFAPADYVELRALDPLVSRLTKN